MSPIPMAMNSFPNLLFFLLPPAMVQSVIVSPKNSFLATCGGNGQVVLWDAKFKLKVAIVEVSIFFKLIVQNLW